MNGVVCSGALVIIFESLPQRMRSYADDCVQLGIKRLRTPKGVDRDAVLFDLVDSSFEVFFADKRQKSNEVVGPPEYTGRQNVVYFSSLCLKLADFRLQDSFPLRMVRRQPTPIL
jgi:hypothetical protein